MKLKDMLLASLQRRGETIEDILTCSIPLDILEHISTLGEINCFYLNSAIGYDIPDATDKQDMPLIAITQNYIYFHDHSTTIARYTEDHRLRYDPGVQSYPIDDFHLKRTGEPHWKFEDDFYHRKN